MYFRECLDREFLFYGVDNNPYNDVFKLDDTVWEVYQDIITPLSIYKASCLGVIEPVPKIHCPDYYFSQEPLAIVRVEEDYTGGVSGYCLTDVEFNHVWLSFGTEYYGSEYSKFYFKYTPIEPLINLFRRGITSNLHYIHDPLDWLFNERED